jgi:putative transposase
VKVLDRLVTKRGRPPLFIRCDNGPELTSQRFADWCTERKIEVRYIQPGKPDQNAFIERFNRSYRTEVLNAHLFDSPADLQALTDAWLRTYNHERPHDSLGRRPPLTFLPRPSSAAQSTNALSA